MTTGEALTLYMDEHGITIKLLAHKAQLDYRTVESMCLGNRNGALDSWMRIADALECGIDELIRA